MNTWHVWSFGLGRNLGGIYSTSRDPTRVRVEATILFGERTEVFLEGKLKDQKTKNVRRKCA